MQMSGRERRPERGALTSGGGIQEGLADAGVACDNANVITAPKIGVSKVALIC